MAKQPWLIGFALAELDLPEKDIDPLLVQSLRATDANLQSLARGLIGKRLEREKAQDRGEEWAYRLLDRAAAEQWSTRMVVGILAMMQVSRELWNRIEQFGPDVSDEYWKHVNPYSVPQTPEDTATAIDKLMKQKRADAVLGIITRKPRHVPSAKIVEILRGAVHTLGPRPDNNDVVMLQYHLEELLTELDERGDVDDTTIGRLEWQYLPLLMHSKRPPRALHKGLSESPSFFLEVLKTVYRSSTEPETPVQPADDAGPQQQTATQAYELLQSWHTIPGKDNAVIDAAKLEAWVSEVRRLAHEAGRIGPCDVFIGRMLAYAPIGDDGIWPAAAVRNVIESSGSDVIERNIGSGLLDKRGVTVRNPDAGGEPEWQLAKQYRGWSEALRSKAPHTSAALRDIAEMFEGFAQRHDQDVERSSWH